MSDDKDEWKGLIWINAELRVLERKNDPASRERYDELADKLISMDMQMGPIRCAMGRAVSSVLKGSHSQRNI